MTELPKTYDPAQSENRWYSYWYNHKLYDTDADQTRRAFTVVIPPPNVTGILTLGHILNNTIQDLYIRWNRMNGKAACWIPGMDHAGIATQTKVVGALKDEGINFRDLGREGFVEKVWEWKEKYGGVILQQLRALGVSVDWRRERFTLDEGLNESVKEVFVRLFDEGLIYKGKRIVNWSPAAQTTLSDEEVQHREVTGTMYTLRYKLEDGGDTLLVATVRPETIWGDVAVAVHPDSERTKRFIGKNVVVPVVGHVVPVIADAYVDPDFGTGALKITPAHDPNDYEVGTRHGLEILNTINPDGTMNELAGPLAGMDRFKARKKAVELLQGADLIEKAEPYTHSVGFSERGGEQIEPFLSDQWYVSMKPLAEPALRAVTDGHIRLYPEHWLKTYEHWMSNIRDWPISRQLWWGHRIPVFYTEDGRMTAARSPEEARAKLGLGADAPLVQDEDVLDTWFSSWLWPFSVHGWGSSARNDSDLAYFYPTDLLVTGPDIIFFWVARMIMAGLHFMKGEPKADGTPRQDIEDLVPFRTVYFTSIIRDAQGRKLSKSLGNSPDPLEVISTYGTDALRFTILYLAPTGQDVQFDKQDCEIGRNFANKMWNAARFLMMKLNQTGGGADADTPAWNAHQPVTDSDRWILSRFHSALAAAANALENYRINDYTKIIYDFVWGDFCDWYLELLKTEVAISQDPAPAVGMTRFAVGLFEQTLRMLHPIMPFVTEELWQSIEARAEGDSISVAPFPVYQPQNVQPQAEGDYALLQELIESVRRMRNQSNLPPSQQVTVTINATAQAAQLIRKSAALLQRLARIGTLNAEPGADKPAVATTEVVQGNQVYLHLEGLIDLDKERAKIEKEIARLEGQIKATQGKLANEKFVQNAPDSVVQTERDKLTSFNETAGKLRSSLMAMGEQAP